MKFIFIDSRISDIPNIVSAFTTDVDYYVFDWNIDTFASLQEKLTQNYESVGIIQHNYQTPNYKMVLNSQDSIVTNVSTEDPSLVTWTDFIQFLQWMYDNCNIATVDLFACELWSNDNWKYIIQTIREKYNFHIRASINITGFGGDFILESDNIDTIGIYFTEEILKYTYAFVLTTQTSEATLESKYVQAIPVLAIYDYNSLNSTPNTFIVNGLTYVTTASSQAFNNPPASIFRRIHANALQMIWTCASSFASGYTRNPYDSAGTFVNGGTGKNWTTSGIGGEWVQIQAPTAFALKGYVIQSNSTDFSRGPKIFYIFGSNNGSTWSQVAYQDGTGTNYYGVSQVGFDLSANTTAYNYYRLVVNAIAGDGYVQIARWILYTTTPPSAPTITSIVSNDGSFTVNFTPPSSTGGSAITGYKYSTDNGNSYSSLVSQTTSPLTITGLTNGNSYNVIIRAVNALGDGTASNMVSKKPGFSPSAPTITSIDKSFAIAINFTPPSSSGTSSVIGYKYSTDNGITYSSAISQTTTSPLNIIPSTNTGTCNIRIKAVSEIGDGIESNTVSVTIDNSVVTMTNGTLSFLSNGNFLCTFLINGTIQFPNTVSNAQVLIVGGGGGGGFCTGGETSSGGGGGGGGGVGVGTLTFASGNSYAITVGNGGNGGIGSISDSTYTVPTNGGNSSIVGGTINAVANGGGFGASNWNSTTIGRGSTGGSGGGAVYSYSNGSYRGNATTGSGNGLTYYGRVGGTAIYTGSAAGGGGGATSDGSNNIQNNSTGANGGTGYTWYVTGNTYGAGGGGSTSSAYNKGGIGGSGIGGNGGYLDVSATSGLNYTGSGGGGAFGQIPYPNTKFRNGGNGGSGIVLMSFSMPATTGSAVTAITVTSGINKVTVSFTGETTGWSPAPTYFYTTGGTTGTQTVVSASTPFDISTTSNITIFIGSTNSAGNVFSTGVSGVPFVLGSKPTISSIVPKVGNSIDVSFSQTSVGYGLPVYYYSFNGLNVLTDASATSSPLTIRNLTTQTTPYTIYLMARNEAGDVSSNAFTNVSVLGTTPTLTAEAVLYSSGVVRLTYAQTSTGTTPVTYYYSTVNDKDTTSRTLFSSNPLDVSGVTGTTTYYVIADNSGGKIISDGSSVTPYLLGSTPTLTAEAVLYSSGVVRLTYTQTSTGTTPVTYYYTTVNNQNTISRTIFSSNPLDVSGVTGTTTYYVIADNSGGKIISDGASVTPYLLGSKPTLTADPVLNSPGIIRLTYTQTSTGTTPVTYYYSTVNDKDTTSRTLFSSNPIDLSGVSGNATYYVIADNSGGKIISDGSSVTPYLLGSTPTINSIVPNVGNSITVNFSQTSVGNDSPVYYYSFDGTNVLTDASSTSTSLTIPNLTSTSPYTIYLVARNKAGDVISDPSSGINVLGSKPTIDSITQNIGNSVTVSFTQSQKGTDDTVYYASLDGSSIIQDVSSSGITPLTISGLTSTSPYTIYVIARNPAGDVVSDPSTGNVRGTKPTIDSITQNVGNSVTVSFTQSQKGTDNTVYYGSIDGSSIIQDASSSGTSLTIPNLTSTSPYTIYVIARNPAGDVVSDPSSGINVLGSKPTIDSITSNVGNSVTVSFTQSQKGTDNTVYYASLDGSSIIQDASSSGTSLTISDLSGTSPYNIYVIARNPAGDVVSDPSTGINILGSKPTIDSITQNIGNSVTVSFTQSQKGTDNTVYYASLDGSSIIQDASSSGTSLTISDLSGTSPYNIYVIARNPAGDVVSDPSLNVSVLGSVPSFTLVPQTNNLRGTITQTNKGTLPVRYYYSSNGTNKDFEVSSPTFDISGTTTRTFYIIADNSAGMVTSSPVTGTPYIFGTVPTIDSIVSGSEKLTVNFSQETTGTTPVTYYYSYDPSGTTRIGQVNLPSFDIIGIQPRTVYIVVDNSAGTLVSQGVSGTPYTFGSTPIITLIQRGSEKITVTFTQTNKGTEPVRYYYSFDRVNRISEVTTNTFDILYDIDSRIGNITYNVTESGGLYSFSGGVTGTNPSITVVKGSVLTFNVNSPGHPLWIKTASVTGTDNAITTDITNNGTQSGNIVWNTNNATVGTYYYICQYHSSMVGSISLIPPENNRLTTTKNVSIIADNSAGTLISADVSGTPYTFGSVPVIQSVTPGPNKLTVLFSQETLGNTPSTYSYSFDASGTNPITIDSSSTFIINGTQPRTVYVIATNLAGALISTGVSGTPFVVGDIPVIDDVTAGPYSLTVQFSQQNQGNTPVTYYYSFSSDGSNPQGPVTSPFTVTASNPTTIYVAADSSGGYLVSAGYYKVPFILGDNPVITNIQPGTETLTVSFSQASKGTEPVTYYYSFLQDGSGRIGPVISPFSISTTITRTVYVVASNPAGNLVSTGVTQTPYTFGSNPVISDIVPSAYNLKVYFSQSTTGTTPVQYYYSESSNGSNRVGPVTSPFDISGSITRTVYIVADNAAGNVVSLSGFTKTPYIFGSTPVIDSIEPGPNKMTVTFSQSSKGTEPVNYYYSYDPSGLNGVLTTSPFVITGTSTRTVYIVANNIIGNVVSAGVTGTPYVVGDSPVIESVVSQTNNLRVTFSHPNPGNTAVTYYYSDDASGNNLISQVTLPTFDISGTITRTIYVVSVNSAGKLISEPVTATPFTFGTVPVIESVTPGTERLFVKFRQDQTGTTPITYYYSFLSDGSNAIGPVDSSFSFAETLPRTIYIVATNSAGTLVSAGVPGTPFVYGSKPIITEIEPGLNKLTVSFNQTSTGTTPVTYYYSESSNGTNRVGPVTSPFDISNITTSKTVYIVADNSAGIIVSDASSGTPYLLGTTPVVDAIQPGTNKLTVSFSQTSLGTTPVTYYYSESSNGANRVGPVTSPFDISNIQVTKTIYIVAENAGGTLVSVNGATGTPYIFGSSPSITNVQPGTNSLIVSFNPSVGGTTPITHYYSYDSSGIPRVAQIPSGASTFTITDISSAKTVYVVAENPAGNLVSSGESGTPYIFGSTPVISSVTPGTNKLIVNFSQTSKGTLPVTYYYSFDGTTRINTVNTPSFEFVTTVTRTVYIIVDNSAGTLVSAGVAGTPYIFGSALSLNLSAPTSNVIRVSYSQSVQGTLPTTYSYVLNGGPRVTVTESPFDISGLTATTPYSLYMIASNDAGDLSSNTVTQSILGTAPVISSVTPGINKLIVNFSQTNRGTLPVTYYYSFDGTTRINTVNTPSFEFVTTVERTVYIIADNSAGTIVSAGVTEMPYVVGVPPTVNIQSGINKITVSFSQTNQGATPVTYYYSDASNGSNQIGPVTSPFDISNITTAKTIYIVANNIAGNVISSAATGIPYTLGSAPVINNISSIANGLVIDFSGSTGGYPEPYTYYYSLDGGEYINANRTTSPLTITGLTNKQYIVTLIAQNLAGESLPSNSVSGTPTPPEINPVFTWTTISPAKMATTSIGSDFAQSRKQFLTLSNIQNGQTGVPKTNSIPTGRLSGSDVINKKRLYAIALAMKSKK